MKPICKKCRRFFRPLKNGISFLEGAPRDNDAPPGNKAPERWRPYKLWMGDLWECRGCGAQIVVGTGREPVLEHHKPDFQEAVKSYSPAFQVNDC